MHLARVGTKSFLRLTRGSRISRSYFASLHASPSRNTPLRLVGGTVALIGAVGVGSYLVSANPIHADSSLINSDTPSQANDDVKTKSPVIPTIESSKNDLTVFVWGSNKNHTTSMNDASDPRRPRPFSEISGLGVALRDLAFCEKHAACVDASGNVYQWGDGFFEGQPPQSSRVPTATLTGKDIVKITVSGPKLYALSRSGQVYALSSSMRKQKLDPDVQGPAKTSSWFNLSWLSSSPPSIDFIELKSDSKLARGERFISISAGRSHLLALTSDGRTFATPITSSANSNGQLGIRKLLLPSKESSSLEKKLTIELLPKAAVDPFAMSTPAVRRSTGNMAPTVSETFDDEDVRYSDTLFEIPSLKGLKVSQAVANERASYVLTANEGKVLAWGANEYGQIGLGSSFVVDHVPIPTEVPLSRYYPSTASIKCTNISAGGDVAYFTIQATSITSPQPSIDLLSCGMGQYGSLGNNLYTQSQGSPVKVKSVSGIQEYHEATKSLRPLGPHTISASPTNHVIATLDTFEADQSSHVKNYDGPAGKGRDIMAWGANGDYQLGTGKRSNMSQPVPLPSAAFIGTFDVDPKVERMMTKERHVDALKDLTGKTVKKNAQVEQAIVAGWNCSAVYWKVST